jgi:hypothetical protein
MISRLHVLKARLFDEVTEASVGPYVQLPSELSQLGEVVDGLEFGFSRAMERDRIDGAGSEAGRARQGNAIEGKGQTKFVPIFIPSPWLIEQPIPVRNARQVILLDHIPLLVG